MMSGSTNRRAVYGGVAAVLAIALAVAAMTVRAGDADDARAKSDGPQVVLYKNPNCGCCGAWADHLRANGFRVETVDTTDLAGVKEEHGVPRELASCHTALVSGRVIEGHVPADLIRRFLEEGAEEVGLAVPGMPVGSPGMEIPGRAPESYDVFAFDREGTARVYDSR